MSETTCKECGDTGLVGVDYGSSSVAQKPCKCPAGDLMTGIDATDVLALRAALASVEREKAEWAASYSATVGRAGAAESRATEAERRAEEAAAEAGELRRSIEGLKRSLGAAERRCDRLLGEEQHARELITLQRDRSDERAAKAEAALAASEQRAAEAERLAAEVYAQESRIIEEGERRADAERLRGALRSIKLQIRPPNGSGLSLGDIVVNIERIADAALPPVPAQAAPETREERLRSLGFSDERPADCVGSLVGLAPPAASPGEGERCPWYEDGQHRGCHGAPSRGERSTGPGGES